MSEYEQIMATGLEQAKNGQLDLFELKKLHEMGTDTPIEVIDERAVLHG